MAELFQINKSEKVRPILEFPFEDEVNDLEPFIRDNSQVLGESIQVFAEQIDTGAGDKIDLLALDRTGEGGQITVVELKNAPIQQQVLLQTLRYANWVRNNPDSVRLLLERKKLTATNVSFNPKIIIVAPQIDPSLLELSQYIQTFDFDFIELKRFGNKESCYLVTDHKELVQTQTTKVSTQEPWNWDKYESDLGISKERVEIGKSLFIKIKSICEERQWRLTPKFNQNYIPFKFGSRNVIYIAYWFRNQFCYLGFKLGKEPEKLGLSDPYPKVDHRFYPDYGEYYVVIEKPDTDLTGYIPFMQAAYINVTKE